MTSSPLTNSPTTSTPQIPAITIDTDTKTPHLQIPFPSKKDVLEANRKVTVASKIPKGACPTKLDQLKKAFANKNQQAHSSSASSLLSVHSIQSDDHLLQLPNIGNQDVESFLDDAEYEEMMKDALPEANGTWQEEVVEMETGNAEGSPGK